jgi:tetratricopeptide (TPR) repeat protein
MRPYRTAAVGAFVFALVSLLAVGQQTRAEGKRSTIQVVVLANQRPVSGARVTLEKQSEPTANQVRIEGRTDAEGALVFSGLQAGAYRLVAEKEGLRSTVVEVTATPSPQRVNLILGDAIKRQVATASKPSAILPMQFADKPNFTVAGITDWTAVGGHGSDSILQTSEALARETRTLNSQTKSTGPPEPHESEGALKEAAAKNPNGFAANHRLGQFFLREGRYSEAVPVLEKAYRARPNDYANAYDLARAYEANGDLEPALTLVNRLLAQNQRADLHRLAGDIDEKRGDPLVAVREYEKAARLEPSEQNYFAWGSELLYHRAVWQALEVFQQGEKAYPKSSRMLTALGSAQFAGALYGNAAISFCEVSDQDPQNPGPYSFMGKVDEASPDPLPCVESRLARFVREHPESAQANYLYAMAILKRHEVSKGSQEVQQAETLLEKTVSLDHGCGEAYLQLGILAYSRHDVRQAIADYKQAIAAKPGLVDSYYRLGVAYDRLGEANDAKREFQLHDEIEKKEAAAMDAQRREIKQFMIVKDSVPAAPARQ